MSIKCVLNLSFQQHFIFRKILNFSGISFEDGERFTESRMMQEMSSEEMHISTL